MYREPVKEKSEESLISQSQCSFDEEIDEDVCEALISAAEAEERMEVQKSMPVRMFHEHICYTRNMDRESVKPKQIRICVLCHSHCLIDEGVDINIRIEDEALREALISAAEAEERPEAHMYPENPPKLPYIERNCSYASRSNIPTIFTSNFDCLDSGRDEYDSDEDSDSSTDSVVVYRGYNEIGEPSSQEPCRFDGEIDDLIRKFASSRISTDEPPRKVKKIFDVKTWNNVICVIPANPEEEPEYLPLEEGWRFEEFTPQSEENKRLENEKKEEQDPSK